MKTLDGAFKKIYGEELAKYGFKKIKGRQPYFGRLIGDEIVQVITYMNNYCLQQGYKEFTVYGGVATVYRQELTLNEPPRNNGWIKTNVKIYARTNPDTYDENFAKKIFSFFYKQQDKASLEEAVRYSLEITKQIMLPEFNKITDLNTCMDYFYKLNLAKNIYDDKETFGNNITNNYYDEGLLHLKVENQETYISRQQVSYEKMILETEQDMITGRIGLTKEDFEKSKRSSCKAMQSQIEKFKYIINNPTALEKVNQELERRKIENTKRLREYGFDI